ncbi:hypothetical protein [Paenibacillus sp. y28]|uniref:hypothetical protein n=1 Tax=Paenibacillus sp. y28 TaxID=3129110 RepID=UPI00301B130A
MTGYNVKRSIIASSPYEVIATVTDAVSTDTNVVNGTTYYYVVRDQDGLLKILRAVQVSHAQIQEVFDELLASIIAQEFANKMGTNTTDHSTSPFNIPTGITKYW